MLHAATGRLLFTGYFDEMKRYFEYDREIIGYVDEDDLIIKLRYYLSHPEEE
ncbi:glycosyltransferase [Paenibacillus macquariensis]|uniref:Glycosyl transferases group 1 n=1 Tax=Paenibacillus macquariensis TaxID=948756 RepID=A0ABY1JUD8_9BACL|nr:glycosyltransferase [Paenibacillus macquariensis]MEC0090964.1 glycosyltransferase [Paenibacillus macquariensis]SIQ79754.1 Glycosyl transferases group 1 [Paenibacillus macquariensis]